MKNRLWRSLGLVFFWSFFISPFALAGSKLLIFAGAAVKPPLEEVARIYEKERKVKVELVFGGSGYVLSQMILSRRGDLYFPGSSDYMELAKEKGVVYPETERRVAYLVPAIVVKEGNPKHIKGLRDLLRPGVRVAMANPEGVCVGAYAIEIVEHNFTPEERERFRQNLVNYTRSCAATAMAVMLENVDVVLGWRVFAFWAPEKLDYVPLKKEEVVRVGYLPIAVVRFTLNRRLAEDFQEFLLSDTGRAVFRKYHYFMTPEEAFAFIGERKPVGGRYRVPERWFR